MTKAQTSERAEAIEQLRGHFKPGDTAFTILRSVSRSGMSREISVVTTFDGKPWTGNLDWLVATATRSKLGERGVKVGGCGMDMGFHLIYSLSHALYSDGFDCVGAICPSNDHSNGDRHYEPHHHSDGGYAISQRWL